MACDSLRRQPLWRKQCASRTRRRRTSRRCERRYCPASCTRSLLTKPCRCRYVCSKCRTSCSRIPLAVPPMLAYSYFLAFGAAKRTAIYNLQYLLYYTRLCFRDGDASGATCVCSLLRSLRGLRGDPRTARSPSADARRRAPRSVEFHRQCSCCWRGGHVEEEANCALLPRGLWWCWMLICSGCWPYFSTIIIFLVYRSDVHEGPMRAYQVLKLRRQRGGSHNRHCWSAPPRSNSRLRTQHAVLCTWVLSRALFIDSQKLYILSISLCQFRLY